MTARAQWATDRLSAWLRDSDDTDGLNLLDEIRDAVTHMQGCNRWRCGDWNHRHHENQEIAPHTDECDTVVPCADCESYATGSGSGFWATRPTLELIDALGALLERREDAVA